MSGLRYTVSQESGLKKIYPQKTWLKDCYEILSDMGSQFISDFMKEVERLLKICHLSTTPYHSQCNGHVEKFNGTLKSMLKKLCVDQPKEWHHFLDALLFAYREVPQESTGFAPFELMYVRPVQEPMNILQEIWSADNTEPEVLTSYRYVVDLIEKGWTRLLIW